MLMGWPANAVGGSAMGFRRSGKWIFRVAKGIRSVVINPVRRSGCSQKLRKASDKVDF
jgi:hypothetical protein